MPILELRTAAGKQVTINARRESTVIMQETDTSFTFDYEGRLVGAFLEGRNYRRSLANDILEKQSGPRQGLFGRLRRTLPSDQVQELETRAYDFARLIAAEVDTTFPDASSNGHSHGPTQSPDLDEADPIAVDNVRQALSRVQTYDYLRLQMERETFKSVYRPVTILPPDQYLALYLQATEGCSYNHCTFCGFYRDRRFRMKSLAEFRSHILAVREFFGGGMSLRRSIFLGDANALTIPQTNLLPMFEAINAEFSIIPPGLSKSEREKWERGHPIHFNGIYSFIDAFSMHRKTPRHYQQLAERGLRRVYVGLETGDEQLLHFLGKPNRPQDVIELVNDVKAGGIAVGIIVLVGAGGKPFQEAHIRETGHAINAMPLDQNDIIYFSEVVDYPGSSYALRAAAGGIQPLTVGEIEHQMVRLRTGFEFRDPARAPKVSYYDIREFVY